MKTDTMRRIDRWVGVPVCAFLTGCRWVGGLWRLARKSKPASVRRIVIVKLAEQGATVLAYPAIRKAVEMVGRENVHFVVFAENRFILDVMEIVPRENVITIPTGGIWRVFVGAVKALMQLRRIGPDAAIDYEFFARSSAAIVYLCGAPIRVGLHAMADGAPYRGRLMTHELRYDPQQHTSEIFFQMIETIDLPPGRLVDQTSALPTDADALPIFAPDPGDLAEMEAAVAREAGTNRWAPLVLLNANASDLLPLRRWPTDRYVELARRLIDRGANVHVAFTGAPDEADVADELVAAVGSDRCFSMAGKTTLRQLLVLYGLADVLVTNDSGPAHFATLTPIHVVTLFGPETPARFGSRSPRAHMLWKDISCSPCVDAYNNRLSNCRDNKCMQEISLDEVLETVSGLL